MEALGALGGHEGAADPQEERFTEGVFEVADHLGHGRRLDPQRLRGSPHAAELHDEAKGGQQWPHLQQARRRQRAVSFADTVCVVEMAFVIGGVVVTACRAPA